MEMFVEDKRSLLFIHPDSMSSVIIEKYVDVTGNFAPSNFRN